MVYESDFYTTRRPYSSSRPYVSSYNITVRPVSPHMPYPAHKRLVTIVHTPIRIYNTGSYLPIKLHARVRPSIIAAELNRIRYLTRPSYVSYTEKYLNSKDYIDFDDETRDIRAKTDNLLRRIHVFVPRPVLSDYDETSPERLRSDDYVRRIINAKNARKDIESLPWYTTPEKRDIGAGHLACIKYAGGRPQSRRRPYYTVGDLVPGDVKTDVKLMSYYIKNRKAAEDAYPPIHVHHSERIKEVHDAPAPSVKWADEIVHEQETPASAAVAAEQPAEKDVVIEEEAVVAKTQPEIESKPEKRKKEKKLKAKENNENEEAVEYDENGVKKQPDEDTIKKVQDYIEKKAAEKKMEEERRAWEAAERKRIAEEKELERLAKLKIEEDIRIAEIKEQERLEAERQAVIEKAEEARKEAERLVEDEKLYNEAIAQAIADEQERVANEQERELQNKKQDDEDEKVVSPLSTTEPAALGSDIVDDLRSEEHSIHAELSDQDLEAKPYEVDNDEDTQIEEDEHEEPEDLESPFIGEGAASSPQVEEPVEEDVPTFTLSRRVAGGEQGFDWSEYEKETEVEEAQIEAEPAQVDDETTAAAAGDQQQDFDQCEVESQAEVDQVQIEEAEVAEQAQVNETQVEEAQVEEETQEEEVQEEDTQVEEVEVTEDVEETKSEEKSTHEESEVEEDNEDEEAEAEE